MDLARFLAASRSWSGGLYSRVILKARARADALDIQVPLWYVLLTTEKIMNINTQFRLAATRKGRIFLHAVMFAHDHKWSQHAHGVWREITLQGVANPFAVRHA